MRFVVACCSVLLLAGCARVEVETVLKADGSYDRTVEYKAVHPDAEATFAPPAKLDDFFDVPRNGSGLEVTQRTEKEELIVRSRRTVAADQGPLQDIALRESGKPVARNEIAVRSLPNGRYEYTETIHWTGPQPDLVSLPSSSLRASVVKALPDGTAASKIDDAVRSMSRATLQALFGPPRPLLGDLITNQDLGARLVRQRLYGEFSKILVDADSPTDRRKAFLAKLMDENLEYILGDTSRKAKSQQSPDASGPASLTFSVKAPGHVLETNGLTDPITGEVYWGLYAESASLGDVVLRLVYQP